MIVAPQPTTLARLDQARTLLASATSFWDIREIHNVAEAGRAYAQAAGMGQEAINHAVKIKLEAARKGGELLAMRSKQHGGKPRLASLQDDANPPTLLELGLTRDQSSDWQALSRLDEQEFQEVVSEAVEDGAISESAVVARARSKRAKNSYAARQAAPKPEAPANLPGVLIDIADASTLPLADESIDLIVTSPPYALDVAYHDGDIQADGWFAFMETWLAEALRVTKNNGRLALNVPLDTSRPYDRPAYAQAVVAAVRAGWSYKTTIVWDEGNTTKGNRGLGSVNSAARPHHVSPAEMVAVFFKGSWAPSSDNPDDITPTEWQDWSRSVWRFSGESHSWEGHPAAFPIELPRRLIRYFSRVGDAILDPFVGSGSTMLAAHRNNRQAFGFDTSEGYVASARRRLQAAIEAKQ